MNVEGRAYPVEGELCPTCGQVVVKSWEALRPLLGDRPGVCPTCLRMVEALPLLQDIADNLQGGREERAMTTDATDTTTARWTCLGRRTTGSGKLRHAWRNEDGDTLYFAKLPGVPGGLYDVRYSKADGHTSVSGTPTFVDSLDVTDPDRLAMEAGDLNAWHAHQVSALERNAKRSSALDALMAPVLDALRAMPVPQRYAAVDVIVRKVNRV